MTTVVIVGASVGGVRTAQALRRRGHAGPVILIGDEAEPPYDRPPLSKEFLSGAWPPERLALLTPDDADIEVRLGTAAVQLDVAGRAVVLADGGRVGYDAVVLATGAAARPSPWAAASGVHVLRTVGHSRSLREDLTGARSVVIVGGGFIGAEVAGLAAARGLQVTIVDPLHVPMGRVMGAQAGARFVALHHEHGVHTRFGAGVESIDGRAGGLTIGLTSGEQLSADTVVVGIGAVPNDGWLSGSGLVIEDGVLCDEVGRAGDAVYAVGDVARWYHPRYGEHRRIEHWTSATEQASVVAQAILDPDQPSAHNPVDYVWSDQYDWKIQMMGRPSASAVPTFVGPWHDPHPRAAALFGDADGALCGAVTLNWPKARIVTHKAIAAGTPAEEIRVRLAL